MKTTAILAAIGATLAAPAMATTAIPIPEPTSMSLLASAAAAGAVIAWRVIRRK